MLSNDIKMLSAGGGSQQVVTIIMTIGTAASEAGVGGKKCLLAGEIATPGSRCSHLMLIIAVIITATR